MKHLKTLGFYVGLLAIAAATAIVLLPEAFSARAKPLPLEAWVARKLRHLAVPAAIRNQMNPVPLTDNVLVEARDHFADHCAICHGNAGSGHTEMGKNFYPNAPDMREAATQSLSDGELFYAIQNGVRLTGMPAWGSRTAEDDQDSWKVVHFVRHLPKISKDEVREMEKMNPKSQADKSEEDEEEQFFRGDDTH
jgi:mono/diheme cytochrome c family protein